MKKGIVLVIIIVAALLIGVSLSKQDEVANVSDTKITYVNSAYGYSFEYPKEYTLKEEGGPENVVLIHNANLPLPTNGEGPVAITFNTYVKEGATSTLEDWIRKDKSSNFNLGDGELTETNVSGKEAPSYKWSGLYEGRSTAFLEGDRVVVASVTYMSPEDQILSDFKEILETYKSN